MANWWPFMQGHLKNYMNMASRPPAALRSSASVKFYQNGSKTPENQVNTECEIGEPARLNHAEKVNGLFPRDSFLPCKLTVRCMVYHYLLTMFLNNLTSILPIFIIEFLYT